MTAAHTAGMVMIVREQAVQSAYLARDVSADEDDHALGAVAGVLTLLSEVWHTASPEARAELAAIAKGIQPHG